MENNRMWENPCPSFENGESRELQEESREVACETTDCSEAVASSCERGGCSDRSVEAQYVYNVSYVQLTCRARERFSQLMREMDEYLACNYMNSFAGLQVYETSPNMFVVIERYYDNEECIKTLSDILNYMTKCYMENFGRGIRRRQILNFRMANRIFAR